LVCKPIVDIYFKFIAIKTINFKNSVTSEQAGRNKGVNKNGRRIIHVAY